MKEIVKCPNCGKPTIKEKLVYPPEEIKEVPLKDHIKTRVDFFKKQGEGVQSVGSGWVSLDFPKPVQLVYECSTCGFTKVVNL